VDPGVELLRDPRRRMEGFGRAVEEVLQPNPCSDSPGCARPMCLEEAPVGLQGLEEVEARCVGHIRDERGAKSDLLRGSG
jgi:hypothetical protein